jgi:hypothetical protein
MAPETGSSTSDALAGHAVVEILFAIPHLKADQK